MFRAIVMATAFGTILCSTGSEAITLSGGNETPAVQSGTVKVQCVGGRRCVGGWGWRGRRRFCRRWVVCR